MKADLLVLGISELVTAEGAGPKRGRAMRELRIVKHAALAIVSGRAVWIGAERDWSGEAETTVHVGQCAVVPGLVDPHTHAVWAGDRLSDFEARASGVGYEAILAAGGGIRSTIRATASASVDELVALARPRVELLIASGATTIEIKSGYGFSSSAELNMLEAIEKERILGKADIREVFRVPKLGAVAGCMVVDGTVRRNARARLDVETAPLSDMRPARLPRHRLRHRSPSHLRALRVSRLCRCICR